MPKNIRDSESFRVPDKETEKLLRQINKMPGWKLQRTGKNHIMITAPDGSTHRTAGTPGGSGNVKRLRHFIQQHRGD